MCTINTMVAILLEVTKLVLISLHKKKVYKMDPVDDNIDCYKIPSKRLLGTQD